MSGALDGVLTDSAVVATGANIGNRAERLSLLRQLLERDGVRITMASREAVTRPLGVTAQREYRNQVLCLRSPEPWPARRWLEHTSRAQTDAGRRPTYHWGPRRADVDILLLGSRGELEVDDTSLRVPHPEIRHRPFVQRLLSEVGPAGGWAQA
ncbi:MAG: 2-amino-4-hydroxy-6-hydroxymethyldihydropteridine diphosphokinase [Candidatus Dormibacteria bacterium]